MSYGDSKPDKAPQFPEREFDISKFGAVGGGKKDSTEAIAAPNVDTNVDAARLEARAMGTGTIELS